MKRSSRIVVFLVLISLLAAIFAGCTAAPSAPATSGAATKDPIVIGLVTERTGAQTSTGDNQLNGIQMAIDEWNQKGGIKGRQIKLAVEDDTSTPPGAVNAYNKLMADAKPVATFIPNFATSVMAIEPAIKKTGVPAITGASGTGITAAGNPNIFRVRTNDDIMGKLAAEYAVKDLGLKKVGVLYVTGEMGAGVSKVIKENVTRLGGNVVGTESYNPDDKDVTAQLLNLQKAGAELIVGWGYPPDAALVMTNMHQLGLKIPLLGSPAYGISDALKLAKEAANGRKVIVDWAPTDDATVQDFAKKMEARAKLPANFLHSVYYDGANILFQTIEKVGTDPAAIRDGLRAVKGYKGITGDYAFDEKGDGLRQAYIAEIKDGKPVVLKTVK